MPNPSAAGLEKGRQRRARLMGEEIRTRRTQAGMSQGDLGKALARYQDDGLAIPQTTISRWELGQTELTFEQILEIEMALNLRLGTISLAAGYSKPEVDLDTAIATAPDIHPTLRRDLQVAVDTYRTSTKRIYEAAGRLDGRRRSPR